MLTMFTLKRRGTMIPFIVLVISTLLLKVMGVAGVDLLTVGPGACAAGLL